MAEKAPSIHEKAKVNPDLIQKDMRRGPPPVRGVFVYVTAEGQIGHQFRGEPPLNEAELLGMGQYLTQLFALTSLENIQVGIGLTLKKIEELAQKPEDKLVEENAAVEKVEALELMEDKASS